MRAVDIYYLLFVGFSGKCRSAVWMCVCKAATRAHSHPARYLVVRGVRSRFGEREHRTLILIPAEWECVCARFRVDLVRESVCV